MKEQVLDALRGGAVRERLRRRAVGGLSASQVLERLPSGTVPVQEGNPVIARREAVQGVLRVLDELVQEGRVERRRSRLGNSLVDVYRRR